MRRAVAGIWGTPTAEGTLALVVTAVFFALGGLFGCWIAFHSGGGGDEALHAYLEQFLSTASEGQLNVPMWPELIWRTVRWPLAAFLFAFTGLGLLGIPVLSSLRGFFLAFSIASFARVYGRTGVNAAFLLLGVTGLVSIPVFLLLSVQSFSNAWSLATRPVGQGCRELPYHRDFFCRSGLCAGALCVCILMEHYLIPVLLMGAVSVLS